MQFVDGLGPNFVDGRFKMRHARGGQPKKFCEFMFDRIDRLLVPHGATAIMSEPVIVPYNDAHYETLKLMRTNETAREKLKSACLAERWVTPSGAYTTYLKDLYPNSRLPSDHMPLMATVTLPPK